MPAVATPAPADRSLGLDPSPHLEWARRLGVHIANRSGFRYAERQELISVAYLEVVRLAGRFDPGRLEYGEPGHLFRGWAKLSILTACRRAAESLRAGGVRGSRLEVSPLSEQRTPSGEPLEFAHSGLLSMRDAA